MQIKIIVECDKQLTCWLTDSANGRGAEAGGRGRDWRLINRLGLEAFLSSFFPLEFHAVAPELRLIIPARK